MANRRAPFLALALGMTALVSAVIPSPARAQDSDQRLRKVEAEVRALQRKVFPGGDGRYFEQENGTLAPAPTVSSDTLTRLDSVEAQLARLTNQLELNTNTLAQLQARLAIIDPSGSQPAAASVSPAPGSAIAPTAVPASSAASASPATPAATPAPAAVAAPKPAPAPALAVAAPSPQRLAAVQAIAKPSTGDAGDDEYSYGFRLWDAKFYPEAQQQLRKFVDAYPDHWRTSYGMNLLGRAYLDDNKPTEAAPWFLKNYQSEKQGSRAGDSLLYLAQAMIDAGDKRRACIALSEFSETYPALATGRLIDDYNTIRRKVVCN